MKRYYWKNIYKYDMIMTTKSLRFCNNTNESNMDPEIKWSSWNRIQSWAKWRLKSGCTQREYTCTNEQFSFLQVHINETHIQGAILTTQKYEGILAMC